jgi:glycosyltransferase involved in cell wall biosynthesis
MISVIVPVYNTEKYLDRCIQSILSQTYIDFELLLINDGSTDLSGEICDKYAEQDSRVRVFHKENGGVAKARNYGIKRSTGDYVILLDSDDWFANDTCQVLIENMCQSNSDCVICGFNQSHGHIWAPPYDKIYNSIEEFKSDFDFWLNTELLSSSVNKIYKKKLLKSLFPEGVSFGEDLIFSLTYLNECQKISFITNPLYQHEVYNVNSITHSFDEKRFGELELIQRCILDFAKSITPNTYKKYCLDVIRQVKMLLRQENITISDKLVILKKWYSSSCFRTAPLCKIDITKSSRIYAFLVQKKFFVTLSVLHWLNNKLKSWK